MSTRASTPTTWSTGMENSNGHLEVTILDSMFMMLRWALERWRGQMEVFSRAPGKTEFKMESVSCSSRTELRKLVSSRTMCLLSYFFTPKWLLNAKMNFEHHFPQNLNKSYLPISKKKIRKKNSKIICIRNLKKIKLKNARNQTLC